MSADELSTQDDPYEVAYDIGFSDGVNQDQPADRRDLDLFTDGERSAYWHGFRMGLRESPMLIPGRHRSTERDPWWVRAAAWLTERWGRG